MWPCSLSWVVRESDWFCLVRFTQLSRFSYLSSCQIRQITVMRKVLNIGIVCFQFSCKPFVTLYWIYHHTCYVLLWYSMIWFCSFHRHFTGQIYHCHQKRAGFHFLALSFVLLTFRYKFASSIPILCRCLEYPYLKGTIPVLYLYCTDTRNFKLTYWSPLLCVFLFSSQNGKNM